MIKAILFDIDNTLLSFDEYVKESMKIGFEVFGIGKYTDEMFETFTKVNSSLWHKIESGEIDLTKLQKIRWNMIFDALGFSADGVEFEKYFRSRLFDNAIEEPGAMDLIKYLSGKYTLCTASNGPYLQQLNRLKVGKMAEFFTESFISEDIGHSKPSKEFFNESLNRLNATLNQEIAPNEMMIIGDSLTSDMAGGVGFGMKTCFYNPKNITVPDDLNLDYIVSNLSEIKNIL